MLVAFLLLLSAFQVQSEAIDQNGLRKSRQLDLGLQDIQTEDEETTTTTRMPTNQQDDVINGYLPPVSTSLLSGTSGAQNQQAFDFKSANSVEKESDLCKPPFDNELCNIKSSVSPDSEVSKPSQDLMPPLHDVEQEPENKATTVVEPTNEEIKTTVEFQTTAMTTTEKPVTETYKPASTQEVLKEIKTTAEPSQAPTTAEVINEDRSYLPPQPEISAAAQTNFAVVQPLNQNNRDHDHHHHHHHQGDNFNICDDAFHAFLCAPLKARKRITGALPSSLLGQSSFINYQKTFLNPDRETASSNTFRNEYLPPKLSSTSQIPTSYSPTVTSRRPFSTPTSDTFRPELSNSNDKFYLPPLSNGPTPVKFSQSNQVFSTVKPSTTSAPKKISVAYITMPVATKKLFSQDVAPTLPVFNSPSVNKNNFYLPPNLKFQPTSFSGSKSENIFSTIPTVTPVPSTFVPPPAASNFPVFAPQKPVVQPTLPVFSTAKPFAPVEELKSSTAPSPTFLTTPKPISKAPSFAPQPSYSSDSYLPPISGYRSSSRPTTTTPKPTTTDLKFFEQSSNADRSYLPPDPKETAAAQISSAAVAAPKIKNPFHHGRDLCTDPFHSFLCASAKPRRRITGQLPSGYKPESSNTDELRVKPEPSNEGESRVRSESPAEEAPPQNVGYQYPKPVNSFSTPFNAISSTAAPTTGYSYPKPDKIFPLPSQQNVQIAGASTTKKPEPALSSSEGRNPNGYQYYKPDKEFPLPEGQDNIKVTTTMSTPSSTGYSYPKPQKPLPLPTEQKEVRQKPKNPSTSGQPLPTNTALGYQYPKPDQTLKLPEKKGYSYPKPEKRLELPIDVRSKSKLPQNSNLDPLGSLGSADFIPVNKVDFKRAESSKLLSGLKRFGERMKKREREVQLYRKLH